MEFFFTASSVSAQAGSVGADPATFPSTWPLSHPSVDQDSWERLVISPGLAAAHDLYLIAITPTAITIAVHGRSRHPLPLPGS